MLWQIDVPEQGEEMLKRMVANLRHRLKEVFVLLGLIEPGFDWRKPEGGQ